MEKFDRNTMKGNTSWISSSFDIESKVSYVDEKVVKRKRKFEEKYVKKKIKSQTIEAVEPQLKQNNLAWVDQYAPKIKEHLAVNKKKVLQVEEWLKLALYVCSCQQKASVLLLTGPSGCGKSATVKVLANELKLDLKEWSNAYQLLPQDAWEYGCYSNFTTTSQATLFNIFLLQGNKYQTVFIKYNCQRLILVDEYPNTYLRDGSLFHSVLRKYQKMGRCPIIFITTDSSRGQSNEQQLFPKNILEELNISVIKFNPAPSTLIFRVLQRIAQDCNLLSEENKTRKSILENIAACCSGDIRNAINSLQFRKDSKKKLSVVKTKNAVSPVGRDTSLFLFHSLGKVLYCKRETTLQEDAFSQKMVHLNRPPLKEVPEEVFEKTTITSDSFNLFLHQNYLDFMDRIENIPECCTYFGDGDIICSNWMEKDVLQNYSASIVIRSLMFHLYSNTTNHRWKPLHKPQWYNKQKMCNMNFVALRDINQRWKINTRELQTQLLPYLVKLSPLKLTKDERQFIAMYDVFKSKYRIRTDANNLEETETFEDISISDSAIVGKILCKNNYDFEENEEEHLIEEYDD